MSTAADAAREEWITARDQDPAPPSWVPGAPGYVPDPSEYADDELDWQRR